MNRRLQDSGFTVRPGSKLGWNLLNCDWDFEFLWRQKVTDCGCALRTPNPQVTLNRTFPYSVGFFLNYNTFFHSFSNNLLLWQLLKWWHGLPLTFPPDGCMDAVLDIHHPHRHDIERMCSMVLGSCSKCVWFWPRQFKNTRKEHICGTPRKKLSPSNYRHRWGRRTTSQWHGPDTQQL